MGPRTPHRGTSLTSKYRSISARHSLQVAAAAAAAAAVAAHTLPSNHRNARQYPLTPPTDSDEVRAFRQNFSYCDTNGDGSISQAELTNVLEQLGESHGVAKEIMRTVELDELGGVRWAGQR